MTTPLEKCPACGEKIKDGVFSSNLILGAEKLAIVNEFHPEKASHRCGKCGDPLYATHRETLLRERDALTTKIRSLLPAIPIVSLQSPLHWDYSVAGLVTAQSTTGTGVFAEFTSAFTDMFGAQSKVYNQKLRAGEDMCQSILRKEALELGANAILAADIDYAEVGGDKGMLMVCMTGTAVILKNPEVLGEKAVESFSLLSEWRARLTHLGRYRVPAYE